MQNSERKDPKHTATVSIDTVQCPWCDAELDGGDLTDYNLSVFQVTCPECGGLIEIEQSVQYTAHPVDENGDVVDEAD